MAYVLNNIRFRSVSSKALERFYNAKAFMLNEILDERKQFSPAAREIPLLLFNSYSEWIFSTESLLLNKDILSQEDLDLIFERQDSLLALNDQIFTIHDSVFLPEFVSIWKQTNVHVVNNFRRRARQTVGMHHIAAFPLLVEALVSGLQTTLFELYELDCLLGSNLVEHQLSTNSSHQDYLITYVDTESLWYAKSHNIFMLKERLDVYCSQVVKPDVSIPILVKNYTEESVALKNGVVVGQQPLARLLTDLMANPRIKIVEIIH